MNYKYDIAISYANEQLQYVERVKNYLTQNGLKVFFAPEHQPAIMGSNIITTLSDVYLKECKHILVFYSKEYSNKSIPRNEVDFGKSRNENGEKCLIIVYMDNERIPDISSDICYLNGAKKSEYDIAKSITEFFKFNNESINGTIDTPDNDVLQRTKMQLPNDAIIFLSGATGVGKTSTARSLLKAFPEIVVVEESDLIRETLRCEAEISKSKMFSYLKNKGLSFNQKEVEDMFNVGILKKSTTDLTYPEMIKQAKLMWEPLKKICWRLREKGMPAIIEGVSLPFEALFSPKDPTNYFIYSPNMLFINLYVKQEKEHRNRLIKRSKDRNENDSKLEETMKKLPTIRNHNNSLNRKALKYVEELNQHSKPRVYSVDISGKSSLSPEDNMEFTSKEIIKIIQNYFYG